MRTCAVYERRILLNKPVRALQIFCKRTYIYSYISYIYIYISYCTVSKRIVFAFNICSRATVYVLLSTQTHTHTFSLRLSELSFTAAFTQHAHARTMLSKLTRARAHREHREHRTVFCLRVMWIRMHVPTFETASTFIIAISALQCAHHRRLVDVLTPRQTTTRNGQTQHTHQKKR